MIPRTWTDSQIQTLRDSYGKISNDQIAVLVDKTPTAVQRKAERLGLGNKRPERPMPFPCGRLAIIPLPSQKYGNKEARVNEVWFEIQGGRQDWPELAG